MLDSGGNTALYVSTNGDIGINTTTPLAKTHILHTGTGDCFRVDDATADTSPFIINASGNVGIGTTLPNYSLHVIGAIYTTGDVIAISDQSIKKNKEIITEPINKLNQIHGYTFERTDLEDKRKHMGLIAQEVNKVFPELIYKNEDDTMSIAYQNISAVFVEGFRELSKRIEYLEKENTELRDRLDLLEKHLNLM